MFAKLHTTCLRMDSAYSRSFRCAFILASWSFASICKRDSRDTTLVNQQTARCTCYDCTAILAILNLMHATEACPLLSNAPNTDVSACIRKHHQHMLSCNDG